MTIFVLIFIYFLKGEKKLMYFICYVTENNFSQVFSEIKIKKNGCVHVYRL